MSVMMADLSAFRKNLRAVLPSFVLPDFCFGISTKRPISVLNGSFSSKHLLFIFDNPTACHLLISNLYAICNKHSMNLMHACKGDKPKASIFVSTSIFDKATGLFMFFGVAPHK